MAKLTKEWLEATRRYVDTVLGRVVLALDCDPSPAEYPALLLRQALDALDEMERERDEARAEAEKWRSELYFQRGAGDVAAGDRFPWDEEE